MGIIKKFQDWKHSRKPDPASEKPIVLEPLEPRILLSADSLIPVVIPDQDRDLIQNGTQVYEYGILSETHDLGHPPDHSIQPSPDESNLYQPLFTITLNKTTETTQPDSQLLISVGQGEGDTDEQEDVIPEQAEIQIEEVVIPAQAGIQDKDLSLDSHFRGNDVFIEDTASPETIRGPPALPELHPVDSDLTRLDGQIVYLDFDGESGVHYEGPVVVENIDVPAFVAPENLRGQEEAIQSAVLSNLEERFEGTGLLFTATKPEAGKPYSSIYIGGDDSVFSEHGSFLGLAEKVDLGNQDPADNAFVFSDTLASRYLNPVDFTTHLTETIAHEVGHLLGYAHDSEDPDGSVLSSVAVDVKGKTGDVITVDLKNIFSETNFDLDDLNFEVVGSTSPVSILKEGPDSHWQLEGLEVDGIGESVIFADLIFSDLIDNTPFESTGLFYFIPEAYANLADGNLEQGFQGTVRVDIGTTDPPVDISVDFGFSGSGPNAVRTALETPLDVLRAQQRLKYFGFPGKDYTGATLPSYLPTPLKLTGRFDDNTTWAIGLFNAAVTDASKHDLSTWINPSINTGNAPRWQRGPTNSDNVPIINQTYTTDWTLDILNIANENYPGPDFRISNFSLAVGGDTPIDQTHETGLDIDIETPSNESGTVPFYATHTADGIQYVKGPNMNDQVKCAHRDKAKWTHPLQVYTSKSPFIFAL